MIGLETVRRTEPVVPRQMVLAVVSVNRHWLKFLMTYSFTSRIHWNSGTAVI